MASDSDDDPAAILGSTQFEPGPTDYDPESAEKLWDAIGILDERRGEYLVDWAGYDEHGKRWEPTWTAKANCTDALIIAWKKKKELKTGKRQSRKKSLSRRSSTVSSKRTASPSRPSKKEVYVELPMSSPRKRKASAAPDDAQEPPAKRRSTRTSSKPASAVEERGASKSRRRKNAQDEPEPGPSTSKRGRTSKGDDAELSKPKRGRPRKDDEDKPALKNKGARDESSKARSHEEDNVEEHVEAAIPKRNPSRQREDGQHADAPKSKRSLREKTAAEDEDSAEEEEPPKRKSGQPRKDEQPRDKRSHSRRDDKRAEDEAEEPEPPKRKPGRSRKDATPEEKQSRSRRGDEREDDEPEKQEPRKRKPSQPRKDKRSPSRRSPEEDAMEEGEVEEGPAPHEHEEGELDDEPPNPKRKRARPRKDDGKEDAPTAKRSRSRKEDDTAQLSHGGVGDEERADDPAAKPEKKSKQRKDGGKASSTRLQEDVDVESEDEQPPPSQEPLFLPDLDEARERPRPVKKYSSRRREREEVEEAARSPTPQPSPSPFAVKLKNTSSLSTKSKAAKSKPAPAQHDEPESGRSHSPPPEKATIAKSKSKPAPAKSKKTAVSPQLTPPRPAKSVGFDVGDEEEEEDEDAGDAFNRRKSKSKAKTKATAARDPTPWQSPDKLPDDDADEQQDFDTWADDDDVLAGVYDDFVAGDDDNLGADGEEDASEYKPTQTTHDDTTVGSPDKLPTQSSGTTDDISELSTRRGADDDSYRPTQDTPSVSFANGRKKKEKALKPVPPVTPSKFAPHLPPPSSQIEEFTPPPSQRREAEAEAEAEDEDEDERITRRGQELADMHAQMDKDKGKEKKQKVAWADVMEAEAAIDNINAQARVKSNADVDQYINWEATAPAEPPLEQQQDSSIVEETPLSQQGVLAPGPDDSLQAQLRSALDLLQTRTTELSAAVARIAELEKATTHTEPELPSRTEASVSTEPDTTHGELAEAKRLLKEREQTIASLRAEVESLTAVSRDAIDAASRLGKENAELSSANEILKSQATHGVAQARLLREAEAKELRGEVARWRALAELLQKQAARTDDGIRAKAAKHDLLAARVAELEDDLRGQRRLVDDMGAQVAEARDELSQAREQGEYRCKWYAPPAARCRMTFKSTELLKAHWEADHILGEWGLSVADC
ncbi:hypothetical protein AURDEDRAFT_153053 [Auricularia subglabra TFB-10046 SS5]|nr:hypothetical protein AURDEDRAFT_153053 [Auricularia subglabra TFB-10046 SS5]